MFSAHTALCFPKLGYDEHFFNTYKCIKALLLTINNIVIFSLSLECVIALATL